MATIKKIILLALTALMMVGCDWNSDYEVNPHKDGILYGVIVIDSCEYIRGTSRLAHKGNCRFCKERRQKELEELVEQLNEK
jgi:hypothetical protein